MTFRSVALLCLVLSAACTSARHYELTGQILSVNRDKQEVLVQFKCEVHPWMFAYVGVFDHPFFAVTGKDGTFKISGVPNGKYVIEAYHVKTHGANPGVSQEIAVDGNKKVDFTIELK